jgi:hypothetical protein
LASTASGCATVVSGRHAEVTFHSNAPNTSVVVRDKHGERVTVVPTETKVPLKRNIDYVFPARYTATFTAPGYESVDVPIRSTVNPWVLGNVVIGGVIGLGVDSATGAAWKPRQATYYQELSPTAEACGPLFSATTQPATVQMASATQLPPAVTPQPGLAPPVTVRE